MQSRRLAIAFAAALALAPTFPPTIGLVSGATVFLGLHTASHASPDSIRVGMAFHPFVRITDADPVGTVSFGVYPSTDCTGTPVAVASRVAIVDGFAHATGASYTPTTSGPLCVRASYAGDGTVAGFTRMLVMQVGKATPLIASVVHDESHTATQSTPIGTALHLRVTVTGVGGAPLAGTVTITFHDGPGCTGVSFARSEALVDGVVDGLMRVETTKPGPKSFVAEYSGNDAYVGATGTCHDVTYLAYPTISATGPHDSHHRLTTTFAIGDEVHLRVVMSGSLTTPDGAAEIAGWKNADCAGAPYASASGPLTNGVSDGNASVVFNTAGPASVRARYLGDSTYVGREGPCMPLDVVTALPSTPPTTAPTTAPTAAASTAASVRPSTAAPSAAPTAADASSAPTQGASAQPSASTGEAPGGPSASSPGGSADPSAEPVPGAPESLPPGVTASPMAGASATAGGGAVGPAPSAVPATVSGPVDDPAGRLNLLIAIIAVLAVAAGLGTAGLAARAQGRRRNATGGARRGPTP